MRRYSLTQLLLSTSLGVCAGFGLAWLLNSEARTPDFPTPSEAISTADGFSANSPIASASASTSTPSTPPALAVSFKTLQAQVQADPAALRDILQRFERSSSAEERRQIKIMLGSLQAPEVKAFALRLSGSNNPEQRADGYELLQAYGLSDPALRARLHQALDAEQDPRALRMAIQTLHYDAAFADDRQAIVSQLGRLTQHAEASVRSSSLAQLSQWQKGQELEGLLYPALADSDTEVRQAAISASLSAEVRSERLKTSLLQLAGNPQESAGTRDLALNALENYTLRADEKALYSQARESLGRPFEDHRARP